MKKAFLVTFTVTTRVEQDVPGDFNPEDSYSKTFEFLMKDARNNILDEPYNYLHVENAEIVEDTECPYGSFGTEEE